MNNNELVSVIIPVYNSEKYLEECLESIINQTYPNIEIIAVDDGSEDSSLDILEQYSNKIDVFKKYRFFRFFLPLGPLPFFYSWHFVFRDPTVCLPIICSTQLPAWDN